MKAKPAVAGIDSFARLAVDKNASFTWSPTRTVIKDAAVGIALVGLLLGAQSVIAHADAPPKLNVGRSCDAASYAGLADRDKAACMNDENDALATLTKNWSQYASTDRSDCVGMVKTGGPPS